MTERRAIGGEVRAATGNRIEGTALRFGDTALLPDGRRETFAPGAFGDVNVVPLNLQHDPGIALGECAIAASKTEVRASCEVPPGIHALVQRRALSGLSVEFLPVVERARGDLRIIERAELLAVGLVDKPAYPRSGVEARAASATIQNAGGPCQCCEPKDNIQSVMFGPNAWDDVLQAVLREETNVVAMVNTYRAGDILGSTSRGTLNLSATEAGLLAVLADDALETPAGEELAEAAKVTPIHIRPLIDFDRSEYEDQDGVRHYLRAWLDALLYKTAPGAWGIGWPIFEPDSGEESEPPAPEAREKRNQGLLRGGDTWWMG